MQILSTPYRNTPSDAKCYFQNGSTRFFNSLHQQNLFLRHYVSNSQELLSVTLLCRTLALPGDWHRRINPDFLNISYIHSGTTRVRIDNKSFLAEPGDLILLPPGSDYEFGSCEKSVRSAIVVRGSIINPILQNLRGKYVFSSGETNLLLPEIERFFQEETIDTHQLAVWCFDLLSSLKNAISSPELPPELHNAIQYMQKNLDLPLKLEQLAFYAGVSPRTLSRMFKKYFQLSPHKYLIRMRMQKACQMLAWEEFSVKETAISTGYSNALNFSTEFKRIIGCSPTEYRTKGNRNIMPELPVLPHYSGKTEDDVVV